LTPDASHFALFQAKGGSFFELLLHANRHEGVGDEAEAALIKLRDYAKAHLPGYNEALLKQMTQFFRVVCRTPVLLSLMIKVASPAVASLSSKSELLNATKGVAARSTARKITSSDHGIAERRPVKLYSRAAMTLLRQGPAGGGVSRRR